MSAETPPTWAQNLRPYQQENARWLVEGLPDEARGRLLTDGLGVGKSFSALGAMRLRWESGLIEQPAMLCFTTASSAFDWKRAAAVCWPELEVHVIGAAGKAQRVNEGDEAFEQRKHPWKAALRSATKPTLIVGDYWWADVLGQLTMVDYDVLIDSLTLDEAHLVKKASSGRAKAIRQLVARSRQTTMLTGTPVHNRPHDLHNLLTLMAPTTTPNFWTWARRYFQIKLSDRNYEVVGGLKSPSTKAALIQDIEPLVWGRTAAQLMGKDMPARNFQLKYVEVDGAVRISPAKLKAKKTDAVDALLRSMVSHKLKAAAEIVRDADKPVVLYTYRKEDAVKLAKALEREKLTFTLATGDLSPTARDKAIENWKQGASQALVCTMDAVRESATLTRADLMVFVDLHWLPATMLQNMGRIDPARQPENERRPVTYLFLVVRNGPDEVVAEVLTEKIREASNIGVKTSNADAFGDFLGGGAGQAIARLSESELLADVVDRIVTRENRMADLEVL